MTTGKIFYRGTMPHLMKLKRSEFWEWMNTCPSQEWFQADDDGNGVRIYFPLNEDEEKENV